MVPAAPFLHPPEMIPATVWDRGPPPRLGWAAEADPQAPDRPVLLRSTPEQRQLPRALGLRWRPLDRAWFLPSPLHVAALRCFADQAFDEVLSTTLPNLPPRSSTPPAGPLLTWFDQTWVILAGEDSHPYFLALGWRANALGQLWTDCPHRARLAWPLADAASDHQLGLIYPDHQAEPLPPAPALSSHGNRFLFLCSAKDAGLPTRAGFHYDVGARIWHTTSRAAARQLASHAAPALAADLEPSTPPPGAQDRKNVAMIARQALPALSDPLRGIDHALRALPAPLPPCVVGRRPVSPIPVALHRLNERPHLLFAKGGPNDPIALVRVARAVLDTSTILVLAPPKDLRRWADGLRNPRHQPAIVRQADEAVPAASTVLASIELAATAEHLRDHRWSLLLVDDLDRIGDETTQRTRAILDRFAYDRLVVTVPDTVWDTPQQLWPTLHRIEPGIFTDRQQFMDLFAVRDPLAPAAAKDTNRRWLRHSLQPHLLVDSDTTEQFR